MQDPIDGMRRVDPGYRGPVAGKIKFSRSEIVHILIAVIVLSVAFTIILFRGGSILSGNPAANIIMIFALSMVLVVCSFLLHEFGHKFVAQRYGAWSEFRMYPAGLFISLVFAFFGFLFAAPGAVYITGSIDEKQNGKISLAGPGVNFAIAAVALVLFSVTTGLPQDVFRMLAYLNAFLGLFNLIPVPPFDGSKIIRWNIYAFAMAAVIGAIELGIVWFVI